jgi:ABC-type glycerol-3-phosphate transport system permease component
VLAHHRFTLRRPLLGILLLSMLLPGQVTLPATWRLLHQLHILDSYAALLIPAAANAFGALLFRHACLQIPPEMLDAARIDGCSEWRTWWEIVLPMIQPTLVTFAVLSFTANWNAYLWPQIVLQDQRNYTLAMGLANMASMPQQRDLGIMLAATTISILPAFALFLIARNSLQESLTEGAIR